MNDEATEVKEAEAAPPVKPEMKVIKPFPPGTPDPYPGEVVMWMADAKSCRKKGFKQRKCRCLYHTKNCELRWWETTYGDLGASTLARDASPQMEVTNAIHYGDEKNLLYVVMDEELFKKSAPKPRRCQIQNVVSNKTIDMLEAAPLNNTFRATLMAEVGEMPPKEADTYEKIKEWVEYTFPKDVPKPKVTEKPIKVTGVTFSQREHGRCEYWRDKTWGGMIEIHPDEVLKIASQAVNYTDLRHRIRKFITDEAAVNRVTYGQPTPYGMEMGHCDEAMVGYPSATDAILIGALTRMAPLPLLAKMGLTAAAGNPHITYRALNEVQTEEDDEREHWEEDNE